MSRKRKRHKHYNLSKSIAIASIFLLISAFLIQLPQSIFIIGGLGIVLAFVVFGIEGYNYYQNAGRFVIWTLIPVFAALFTYFHKNTLRFFDIEIAKIWLLGLFACAVVSLYYNRWSFSSVVKIFFIILFVGITSITLVGFVYPDVQYNWGVSPLSGDKGSPTSYNRLSIVTETPTTGPTTVTTIPTVTTPPSIQKSVINPTPIPKISLGTNQIEQAIYRLTNTERTKAGLSPLGWNGQLAIIAREHSQDMASNNFFSHTNLRGEGPDERATRHGYPIRKPLGGGSYMVGIGENIGMMPTGNVVGVGYVGSNIESIAQAQVQSWMDSPGHRSNILNTNYNAIGVGVAYDGHLYYISTQDFQ
jgi:uncharacterized protein YkwD